MHNVQCKRQLHAILEVPVSYAFEPTQPESSYETICDIGHTRDVSRLQVQPVQAPTPGEQSTEGSREGIGSS